MARRHHHPHHAKEIAVTRLTGDDVDGRGPMVRPYQRSDAVRIREAERAVTAGAAVTVGATFRGSRIGCSPEGCDDLARPAALCGHLASVIRDR
jgi:hypothetical protein